MLVIIGAIAMVPGGFGIAFRAAGLGYLPQSVLLVAFGTAALFAGVQLARVGRDKRFAPAGLIFATGSTTPVHTAQWAPEPERMKVRAWAFVEVALCPPEGGVQRAD